MTLPRVAIGLCDGLARNPGLGLETLRRRLQEITPPATIEVVPDLCGRPAAVRDLVARSGAARLVLALCSRETATGEYQAFARRTGLDPYGIALVVLRPPSASGRDAADDAANRLAAAAARLRVFGGSDHGQLRMRLSDGERVSRRALFTLPPVTYEAIPGIDDDRCLGAKRCGLCIQACPVAAIGVRENDVAITKDRCVTCGICVSTCPAAAIAYPGASFGEYEAEIGALLRRPSRLLFACAKNRVRDVPLGTGWAPIDVPCLGMVTPGWILQSLAAGASAVALLPCDSCEGGSAARAASRLEYVRALLGEIGDAASDDRVALLPSAPTSALPHPSPLSAQPAARVTLAEPAATVEAVLALAGSRNGAQDVRLSHPGSPLGIVRVRRETCTLCGACADACPTRALERGDTAAASLLSYDPALCIACERCAAVCPEGASETIEVHRVTDTAALAHGRATLKRDAVVCCRKCGRPVAPQAMLDRVRTMLEDENGAGPLLDVLTALCADCRSLATWS